MPDQQVLAVSELPAGTKKTIKLGELEILLVHVPAEPADGVHPAIEEAIYAVEASCPHAGAALEKGAVCHGRLICPWHMGTFELAPRLPGTLPGTLLEPPPLRSLAHYPVRVAAGLIYVDPQPANTPGLTAYDEHAPASAVGTNKHVVMVGNGAASVAAITALRQAGFSGRLTVIDPVETEPVDRTVLSKTFLAGKTALEKLPIWKAGDTDALRIDRLQDTVTGLDVAARSLTLSSGESLTFDAALVATGGEPVLLGIDGESLPHVHTIRHQADSEAILKLVDEKTLDTSSSGKAKAVVIGDSFIALEAAAGLTVRGAQVTLVSRSTLPFGKQFGEQVATALLNFHRSRGVTLKLGAEAQSMTAEAVTLKTGEVIAADVVVVAIGIRPVTGFLRSLDFEKDGSIAVGADLKAAPGVWVAGDIAQVDGTRIEHWRVAEQHGRAAAYSMLDGDALVLAGTPVDGQAAKPERKAEPQTGQETGQKAARGRFQGVPFFWTMYFAKRFGYLGQAASFDDVIIDGKPEEQDFIAYYLQGEHVAAVLACGRDSALAALAEGMRQPLTLVTARQLAAS